MIRINLLTNLKRCPKCGQYRPHIDFSRNKSRKDGLSVWCRSCEKNKPRKGPKRPWKRRNRKPPVADTPGIKRSPGSKRRAVAGSELEVQIWALLTGTLIPMSAIAKKLRVSAWTVQELSKKWFPGRKRRYQWTKYETRKATKRKGYD